MVRKRQNEETETAERRPRQRKATAEKTETPAAGGAASSAKKKRGPRKTAAAQEPVTPVEETVVAETPGGTEVVATPGGTRRRREVTPETVDEQYSQLVASLEAEIARQRDVKEKNGGRTAGGGIKFLRSALKNVKQLQSDTRRIARKKRATRHGNNNSGFLKEAPISSDMAHFLGVKEGSSMSRVDCTKRLHEYICKHNLQNPDNRREIRPDKSLAKLLAYNKKTVEQGGHGPLYYYVMQKLIQPHFVKTPAQ